ncbi:MAG: transposase [Bdellovibrionales bacterium]|nr:transposase [Bdellovibrionales bacterium]
MNERFCAGKRKIRVLYDEEYISTAPAAKFSARKLRHIIYRDKLTQKVFHFVTSDQKASAKMIANIYKRRWAVELLFRWMKGHLDIRRLPLKTPNAIHTQLAIAVLVQLLLQLKRSFRSLKELCGNFCARCEPRSREKSFRDAGLRTAAAGAPLPARISRYDFLRNKPVSSVNFLEISQRRK